MPENLDAEGKEDLVWLKVKPQLISYFVRHNRSMDIFSLGIFFSLKKKLYVAHF